jgi:UDP-glucose 6-dehydrogenase
MHIAAIGSGYVGLVERVSQFGVDVTCVDVDEEKSGVSQSGCLFTSQDWNS